MKYLLLTILLAGSAGARASDPTPSARVEPTEGEVREAAWTALLKHVSEEHGCRAVKSWESVVRWVRVVEFDCDGLMPARIFAWNGQVWLPSEIFAPQDPSMVR